MTKIILSLIPSILLSVSAYAGSSTDDHDHTHHDVKVKQAMALFNKDSTKVEEELVPCTLSGGLETTCLKIHVMSIQTDHKMGPWCPRNISDSKDKGGIWMKDDKVYDADGNFMEGLAAFYADDEWQIYDKATGKINVTDSKEACAAAAKPDVEEEYQNHCVECLPSYVEVNNTYLIPANPVKIDKSQRVGRGGVGLAFNGVKFDGPAPLHAILAAHTIAPFDDCGGHVNLHVGYHYHAVTGCSKEVATGIDESHAKMIGYALDGFPLHSRLDANGKESDDLDECRGHEVEGIGYHYHVNDPGKNETLSCLKAESGCEMTGDSTSCKGSSRSRPPKGSKGPKGPRPKS